MARNAAALILARQAKRSKQFKRLAAAAKKVGPTIAGTEGFGVTIEELTVESIVAKTGAPLKIPKKPIRQVRKVIKKRKKRSVKGKIKARNL